MKHENIHEAIPAIKAEIAKKGIAKDGYNQQSRFNYRSIYAIQSGICGIEAFHGVYCYPLCVETERGIRTTSKGAEYPYTVVSVIYRLCHSSGTHIDANVEGEGADYGDKGTSKAMTSAFKTLLNQLYNIPYDPTEDPDASSVEDSPEEEDAIERITEDQAKELADLMSKMSAQDRRLANRYLRKDLKCERLGMLRADIFDDVKEKFASKIGGGSDE